MFSFVVFMFRLFLRAALVLFRRLFASRRVASRSMFKLYFCGCHSRTVHTKTLCKKSNGTRSCYETQCISIFAYGTRSCYATQCVSFFEIQRLFPHKLCGSSFAKALQNSSSARFNATTVRTRRLPNVAGGGATSSRGSTSDHHRCGRRGTQTRALVVSLSSFCHEHIFGDSFFHAHCG